tara:strand:+ start:4001 stop:5197 length:1197 start_codon:yes stop_codon:yes gene_type:complete
MAENILLVIEGTYPWYRGGVSEWTYQYLRSCKTINFSILQIATDEFQGLDPHKALYPLTDNIVDFTRISPPNMSNSWEEDSIEWYASISDKLQELAQFSSCIHVTNTGFAGWLGAEIATKMDKPLVLTEHAIYWEEIKKGAVALECGYKIPDTLSAKNHVVQTFINIAKRVYSVSDKVISVSRCNLEKQIQLGASNPLYIPNGIPKEAIVSAKKRTKNPVIGWVGRCAEMKNPKLFFEFIAEFKTLDLNPQFVMMLSDANEKVLEDEVRELAEKHTDIDMIWNQSAIEHMHRLDMLCITSHNESQPLVLFEALANMALPIGWEVGDVDSEFAFVVQDDITSKQFAQEVESLWNNRTLFNEMVEERHQKVKEEHNWTTIFDKYQDIFSKNNLIRLQANL